MRLRLLLLIVFLMGGAAAAAFYFDYQRFTQAPLLVRQERLFDVRAGMSFQQIAARLREQSISDAPVLHWRLLAWQMGVTSSLHAGEYAITPDLTPRTLLLKMASGEVLQHRTTIVEGWTFRQLRVALAQETDLVQTLSTASDEDIARRLDIADGHPEGWFLPETYVWVKNDSDFDVLKRAHAAMRKLLEEQWPKRDTNVSLGSPYEALILASIVEKETGRADERPQIAGVFARRLKIGMRLQTDPTIIYGLGSAFDGNLRRTDLDTDSPYNTYTRAGLPPTPIALPGRAAVIAALHPAPGDALYFVARGDGSHEFSSTLDAHNRAVARFQLHRTP